MGGVTKIDLKTTQTWAVLNTTRHIVVIVDRNSTAGTGIWVNGSSYNLSTETISTDNIDNTGKFSIGGYDDAYSIQDFYDGVISQVGIFKPADGDGFADADVAGARNTLVAGTDGGGFYWPEIQNNERTHLDFSCFYNLTQRETKAGTDAVDASGGGHHLSFESSANIVRNGTFDSDTEWNKNPGWTISGGVASHAAGNSGLSRLRSPKGGR